MSTTSSAQRRIYPPDHIDDKIGDPIVDEPETPLHAQLDVFLTHDAEAASGPFTLIHPVASQSALKQQAAERIAAHRARRAQSAPDLSAQTSIPSTDQANGSEADRPSASQASKASGPSRTSRVRSANIVAAVAERYAHSQTYRAFLASEAERAVHQADAAARVASINAHAIAVAQQQLLADLDDWDLPVAPSQSQVSGAVVPLLQGDHSALFDHESSLRFTAAPASAPSFTVRPFQSDAHPAAASHSPSHLQGLRHTHHGLPFDTDEHLAEERLALDDEIAFRHDPIFDEVSAPEAISANLIEFPRQLIAPRKARPRLAEGPLRDDPSSSTSQLRIFEVECQHITPSASSESLPTEWSSILLSALPIADFPASADTDYLTSSVPHAAPISLRLMSAIVDGCLILTVQVAFTAVFALALTHFWGSIHAAVEIPRSAAVAGSAGTLAILTLLYQLLFFTLSDATPGMRYARIALCTLSDEKPTRSAMRRRILAALLAVTPLGFGLLWAFLDEDSLGWHDRISRMYQRSY